MSEGTSGLTLRSTSSLAYAGGSFCNTASLRTRDGGPSAKFQVWSIPALLFQETYNSSSLLPFTYNHTSNHKQASPASLEHFANERYRYHRQQTENARSRCYAAHQQKQCCGGVRPLQQPLPNAACDASACPAVDTDAMKPSEEGTKAKEEMSRVRLWKSYDSRAACVCSVDMASSRQRSASTMASLTLGRDVLRPKKGQAGV